MFVAPNAASQAWKILANPSDAASAAGSPSSSAQSPNQAPGPAVGASSYGTAGPANPFSQAPAKTSAYSGIASPKAGSNTTAAQPQANSTKVFKTGNRVVIDARGGDDVIEVQQRKDGTLDVSVNGRRTASIRPGAEVEIRGGAGQDEILVDPGVTRRLILKGGSEDDLIVGGAGQDIIHGGEGEDIIAGNSGPGKEKDVIRGGPGRDVFHRDDAWDLWDRTGGEPII